MRTSKFLRVQGKGKGWGLLSLGLPFVSMEENTEFHVDVVEQVISFPLTYILFRSLN